MENEKAARAAAERATAANKGVARQLRNESEVRMLAAAQRAEAKRALLEERARARKDAAKRAKDVVAGEKEEFLEKLREARVASALEEEIRTHEVDGAARSALVVGSGVKLRPPLPLSLRSTGCALSSRRRTRRWRGGSRRCVCANPHRAAAPLSLSFRS